MTSSNFNLRKIPPKILVLLKKEAKKSHISVNTLMLKLIERGLGFTREKPLFYDLDHLAGTWSDEDEKAFKKHTQQFEEIDEELWQ